MKIVLILTAVAALLLGGVENDRYMLVQSAEARANKSGEQVLAEAFKNHRSNFQAQVQAKIIKLLPDDNDGSRHQRFLVTLNSGLTLMVAHNIDIAQRLEGLKPGDAIELYGEYEWNDKGGVLHWTHRDPGRRHIDGWLKYAGKLYQ
jgi:hypothetical protein